jgi:hypothetical protein
VRLEGIGRLKNPMISSGIEYKKNLKFGDLILNWNSPEGLICKLNTERRNVLIKT